VSRYVKEMWSIISGLKSTYGKTDSIESSIHNDLRELSASAIL